MGTRDKNEFGDAWKSFPHTLASKLARGKWKKYPHLKYISNLVFDAVTKGGGRLIINAPPRHGKSEFISHWVPVWFLENFPENNVILTSYEAEAAAQWGRKVRNEFETQELLTTKLRDDSTAANRFNTHKGGGMMTAGVGGPLTGRGAQLIVIDDPVKNLKESLSATKRAEAREWFNWVLYSRAEPGATIVLLMTRWNHDDLAGYLLKDHTDKWTHVNLPALAEANDLLGRQIGEPLCPERYDLAALDAIKRASGSRAWVSLYQQRPTPDSGALVNRSHFKFWKELPDRFDKTLQSWDMTFKETADGSFIVGQAWGKKGADKYLIDQIRFRGEFTSAIQAVKTFSAKHPKILTKLIEDKANGPAIISALKKEIPGIIPVGVSGSKLARFQAVSPSFEAGNVYLPDPSNATWVHDYIEEAVSFPSGAHDDQVDATSQALEHFLEVRGTFTENMVTRNMKDVVIPIKGENPW